MFYTNVSHSIATCIDNMQYAMGTSTSIRMKQLTSTAALNALGGADQDDSLRGQTPMQGDEAFTRSCVTSSSAACCNILVCHDSSFDEQADVSKFLLHTDNTFFQCKNSCVASYNSHSKDMYRIQNLVTSDTAVHISHVMCDAHKVWQAVHVACAERCEGVLCCTFDML